MSDYDLAERYRREAELRARIPFLSRRRPLLAVPEVTLLIDPQMRIVRRSADHAGERLSKMSFDPGHHPHTVFHPDCDGTACRLLEDWHNAWTTHRSGPPVEWLHLSRNSNAVTKFRLQPVSYACGILFDNCIEHFGDHSVLFIQDLTRSLGSDAETARDVHVKNAYIYERRRKTDNDPELIASLDERLRVVTRRLLEARDSVRKSLAAELHDNLGQTLSVLGLEIETVIAKQQPDACNPALEHILERVTRAQRELRDVTGRLIGQIAGSSGLVDSLQALANDVRGVKRGIEWDVDLQGIPNDMPEELGVTIYRIVQESLNNIVRHSNARNASLLLTSDEAGVQLVISDDGVGLPAGCIQRRGLGLITMRERAEALGGTYEMDCPAGQGCTIRVSWPPGVVASLR